jgi:hypothetical protein
MSESSTADLTIIYSSAGKIPKRFAENVLDQLLKAADKTYVYQIYCKPRDSSIVNYYKDLLEAAKEIETPYLATCEDDTLYSDEHFYAHRPPLDTFAYNFSRWNIHTWSEPPFFSLRQRRILAGLIAPRLQFISWLEERFKIDPEGKRLEWWGEPGRNQHEKALGVTQQKSETFETYSPIVVFSHPDSFGYESTGKSKRSSKIRALEIPYFGKASDIIKLYVKE